VRSELPVDKTVFTSQQARWAKGPAKLQTAKKIFPSVQVSDVPFLCESEAFFFHLTASYFLTRLMVLLLPTHACCRR